MSLAGLTRAELLALSTLNAEPKTLVEIQAHQLVKHEKNEAEAKCRRDVEAKAYADYLENKGKPAERPRADGERWAKAVAEGIGEVIKEVRDDLTKRADSRHQTMCAQFVSLMARNRELEKRLAELERRSMDDSTVLRVAAKR